MGAVLAYIGQLYAVEKRPRKCGIAGEDLRLLREEVSRPITNQLHAYLLTIDVQLLPKSEAGQAVAYILKNWLALTRYFEHGGLPNDKKPTQRAPPGLAVGRKKLAVPGSERGGQNLARFRRFRFSFGL